MFHCFQPIHKQSYFKTHSTHECPKAVYEKLTEWQADETSNSCERMWNNGHYNSLMHSGKLEIHSAISEHKHHLPTVSTLGRHWSGNAGKQPPAACFDIIHGCGLLLHIGLAVSPTPMGFQCERRWKEECFISTKHNRAHALVSFSCVLCWRI